MKFEEVYAPNNIVKSKVKIHNLNKKDYFPEGTVFRVIRHDNSSHVLFETLTGESSSLVYMEPWSVELL